MSSEVLAVIPARMGAQRFPGKPLASIAGKPLVQWVWEAAKAAHRVTRVIVATDSDKIAVAVKNFGGEAMMTSPKCPSGTDRVAQVAKHTRAGIVVNIQGDEPLMAGSTIDRVVEALQEDSHAVMSTAVRKADSDREWKDPNCVKAVFDRNHYALYFSRAPIPWKRDPKSHINGSRWVHMGIYGYRRGFLFRFAGLPPSGLEQVESLEQLRALEQGSPIKVVVVSHPSQGVDRPADVKIVERILAKRQKKVNS
jgi:3-deoxy-manno-octulosonate cytidylyltransferase (CMP-KDO synthetase)